MGSVPNKNYTCIESYALDLTWTNAMDMGIRQTDRPLVQSCIKKMLDKNKRGILKIAPLQHKTSGKGSKV